MSTQKSSTAGRRFLALLNIQPGEGRPTGLLMLLYLSLITAVVFVQAIAFGLFVSEIGSQYLPLAYIAIAVLASLVAFVYLKLSERLEYSRLLMLVIAFCGAACAFFWLGLNSPLAAIFVFFLPVWFQILINMANLIVWPLSGRLFDLRQGKRLFGIVGAGNWIANIAGGIIVAPLVAQFGTANMLLVSIAAIVASAFIMRAISRRYLHASRADASPEPKPQTQAKRTPRQPLVQSRYVALIIAYVCLWWVSFFFVDNIFYDRASLQFPNAVDLTAFIGTTLSIIGVIALFVTTLLSSRILQRRGLRAGLILMPLLVTALIAAVALFGALGAAVVVSLAFATLAKVANVSLGFSVSQSANSVMYQALPGAERARVQTVAEGIVQPISIGIAGVLLLVLNTWLNLGAIRIGFIFLFLAAGWMAVIVLLAREYPNALERVLLKRQFREPQTFIADASAIVVLSRELSNLKPAVAVHAMNLLAQVAPAQLSDHIAPMLEHPSQDVREAALQKIEALNIRTAADAVRARLLIEEAPQVKSAALRALAAIDDEVDDGLAVYLRDDDARVAKGALVGLLLHGDVNGVLAAQTRLAQWALSPEPDKRVMAARAIGEAGSARERATLAQLLNDGDADVRRAALWSAGCVKEAALWPQVIAACDAQETERAAVQALAQGDARTVAMILAEVTSKDKPHRTQLALSQACSRINDAAALPALLALAKAGDAGVSSMALAELAARRYAVDPSISRACSREEAARMAWMSAALNDLTAHDAKPLAASLQMECDRARDRILLWLALGGNATAVLKARDALKRNDAAQQAYALEMIDSQLPTEMKGWVMPALEALTTLQRLARWQNAFPQTQQPAHARLRQAIVGAPSEWLSPWTRACALNAIGKMPARECADVVARACQSNERMLREMAMWAAARLGATTAQGDEEMLSTVERVMILKGAAMFAQTPDDALAEVAALLEEADAGAGVRLFEKGDMGDCLYVIVSGRVRIHDGERLLNELGEGDVFGEMALLDPEPRLASSTVSEQARLLRLDRAPFFELINERPEVCIGIIHMLTSRLRERVQDINRLDAQVRALAGATTALP